MKKFSKKLGAIILSLALVLVIAPVSAIFAGCGEKNPPAENPPVETEFTAVGVWRTVRCEGRDEGEDGVLGTADDGETQIVEGVDLFQGEATSWEDYINNQSPAETAFQFEFLEDGSLKLWGGSYWGDIEPIPEEYNRWEQVDNLIVTGLPVGDDEFMFFEIQEDGSLLADLNGDGSFLMILEKV